MKYVCKVCGYVYDEDKRGIPFAQLPEDWKYPLCKAPKSEFEAQGGEDNPAAEPAERELGSLSEETQGKLSLGQLAAICSNLARGCEKQYKFEKAELFTKLANQFSASVKPFEDVSPERLAAELREDAENYASLRATADADKDRGAARVCVWGEKVTRMASSLLERYLAEGEAMFEGGEVWLCTACGFISVEGTAPQICPVCKVPAWKFENMEGRETA